MRVRITLVEEMLGTACSNPDVHREFIANKSADAARIQEELEALPADALMEKALTVFPRDTDGTPFLWDYQLKGFIKEAIGALVEIGPELRVGKTKLSKYTFKRVVDNYIFVSPRKLRLYGELGPICTRPLRADTMRGERVSLASSETMVAGTSFECRVDVMVPAMDELVRSALNYGQFKGLGQWRNSGKGRFTWEDLV